MPLPKTTDVGRLIRFLKKEKPGMSVKQRTAIALSQARRSGGRLVKKLRKKRARA